MKEIVVCDYARTSDGYFVLPSAVAMLSQEHWKQIVAFTKDHSPPPPVERFLNKNPTARATLERMDALLDQLPTINVYNGVTKKNQLFYMGLSCKNESKLVNKIVVTTYNKQSLLPHYRDWSIEVWEALSQIPDAITLIKKLLPHTQKVQDEQKTRSRQTVDGYYLHPVAFVPSSWTQSAQFAATLQAKETIWFQGDDVYSVLGKANSVCVFSNSRDKYFTGDGFSDSIGAAKMYESVSAAKRSIQNSRVRNHLQNITFVSVTLKVDSAIETIGDGMAPSLSGVLALREKEVLVDALKNTATPPEEEKNISPARPRKIKM